MGYILTAYPYIDENTPKYKTNLQIILFLLEWCSFSMTDKLHIKYPDMLCNSSLHFKFSVTHKKKYLQLG